MNFNNMGLIDPIILALEEEGYQQPTPIQAQAIPPILEGRDILGCAQTGTGKTAAFSLPLLQRLNHVNRGSGKRPIRALILTPTRELAIQIKESIDAYGRHLPLKNTVIFGGVGQQPQVTALRNGIDILVATPGRLLDLCQQGHVSLKQLEVFILDEADRMLDMGFIHDVRKIIAMLPEKRQSLFFSATMPKEIQALADKILTNPFKVEVAPPATTAETIQQSIYRCEKSDKKGVLIKIISDLGIERALVFSRTKHGADRIAKDLNKAGIRSEAIHGNKSQNARQNALKNFKNSVTRMLVATDIAARGIDVDDLTHVINFDIPNVPETYVHRIGRTGRAGASGIAISLCEEEEVPYIRDIQKLTRIEIQVLLGDPIQTNSPVKHSTPSSHKKNSSAQQGQSHGGNKNGRFFRRR
jgi:ATP-dependent RNA helicase RhlE